jgi:hypothetical protein
MPLAEQKKNSDDQGPDQEAGGNNGSKCNIDDLSLPRQEGAEVPLVHPIGINLPYIVACRMAYQVHPS